MGCDGQNTAQPGGRPNQCFTPTSPRTFVCLIRKSLMHANKLLAITETRCMSYFISPKNLATAWEREWTWSFL